MAKFEPTRLSAALHRRGMTQREIADHCGVTSQYISMFERGEKEPPAEMINKIASVLRFPEQFFFGSPVELIPVSAVSFRAKRSMTSSTRDQGIGTSAIAVGVVNVDLETRFRLPKADVPDLSEHTPEEAAAILRARWQLGYDPIQNMVHLLEARGVRVYWIHNNSPSLDAFMFWRDTKPFVMLNSLKTAGDRARFDAAHELGHLILHRHTKSLDAKKVEDEANKFASAFLLPRETFERECPDHPELSLLYQLKRKWKVSVSAMVMRGAQLGIFTEWQTRQAFQLLNTSGERLREKVPVAREQSKLHPMVFDALEKNAITPATYAQMLALEVDELKEIMPVANEYLKTEAVTPPLPAVERRKGHMRVIPGGR